MNSFKLAQKSFEGAVGVSNSKISKSHLNKNNQLIQYGEDIAEIALTDRTLLQKQYPVITEPNDDDHSTAMISKSASVKDTLPQKMTFLTNAGQGAEHLISRNTDTKWSTNFHPEVKMTIQFPHPLEVRGYSFILADGCSPKRWIIQLDDGPAETHEYTDPDRSEFAETHYNLQQPMLARQMEFQFLEVFDNSEEIQLCHLKLQTNIPKLKKLKTTQIFKDGEKVTRCFECNISVCNACKEKHKFHMCEEENKEGDGECGEGNHCQVLQIESVYNMSVAKSADKNKPQDYISEDEKLNQLLIDDLLLKVFETQTDTQPETRLDLQVTEEMTTDDLLQHHMKRLISSHQVTSLTLSGIFSDSCHGLSFTQFYLDGHYFLLARHFSKLEAKLYLTIVNLGAATWFRIAVSSECTDASLISYVRNKEWIYFFKENNEEGLILQKVNIITKEEKQLPKFKFESNPSENTLCIIFGSKKMGEEQDFEDEEEFFKNQVCAEVYQYHDEHESKTKFRLFDFLSGEKSPSIDMTLPNLKCLDGSLSPAFGTNQPHESWQNQMKIIYFEEDCSRILVSFNNQEVQFKFTEDNKIEQVIQEVSQEMKEAIKQQNLMEEQCLITSDQVKTPGYQHQAQILKEVVSKHNEHQKEINFYEEGSIFSQTQNLTQGTNYQTLITNNNNRVQISYIENQNINIITINLYEQNEAEFRNQIYQKNQDQKASIIINGINNIMVSYPSMKIYLKNKNNKLSEMKCQNVENFMEKNLVFYKVQGTKQQLQHKNFNNYLSSSQLLQLQDDPLLEHNFFTVNLDISNKPIYIGIDTPPQYQKLFFVNFVEQNIHYILILKFWISPKKQQLFGFSKIIIINQNLKGIRDLIPVFDQNHQLRFIDILIETSYEKLYTVQYDLNSKFQFIGENIKSGYSLYQNKEIRVDCQFDDKITKSEVSEQFKKEMINKNIEFIMNLAKFDFSQVFEEGKVLPQDLFQYTEILDGRSRIELYQKYQDPETITSELKLTTQVQKQSSLFEELSLLNFDNLCKRESHDLTLNIDFKSVLNQFIHSEEMDNEESTEILLKYAIGKKRNRNNHAVMMTILEEMVKQNRFPDVIGQMFSENTDAEELSPKFSWIIQNHSGYVATLPQVDSFGHTQSNFTRFFSLSNKIEDHSISLESFEDPSAQKQQITQFFKQQRIQDKGKPTIKVQRFIIDYTWFQIASEIRAAPEGVLHKIKDLGNQKFNHFQIAKIMSKLRKFESNELKSVIECQYKTYTRHLKVAEFILVIIMIYAFSKRMFGEYDHSQRGFLQMFGETTSPLVLYALECAKLYSVGPREMYLKPSFKFWIDQFLPFAIFVFFKDQKNMQLENYHSYENKGLEDLLQSGNSEMISNLLHNQVDAAAPLIQAERAYYTFAIYSSFLCLLLAIRLKSLLACHPDLFKVLNFIEHCMRDSVIYLFFYFILLLYFSGQNMILWGTEEHHGLSRFSQSFIANFRNSVGDLMAPEYQFWEQFENSDFMILCIWLTWLSSFLFTSILMINLLISVFFAAHQKAEDNHIEWLATQNLDSLALLNSLHLLEPVVFQVLTMEKHEEKENKRLQRIERIEKKLQEIIEKIN